MSRAPPDADQLTLDLHEDDGDWHTYFVALPLTPQGAPDSPPDSRAQDPPGDQPPR